MVNLYRILTIANIYFPEVPAASESIHADDFDFRRDDIALKFVVITIPGISTDSQYYTVVIMYSP